MLPPYATFSHLCWRRVTLQYFLGFRTSPAFTMQNSSFYPNSISFGTDGVTVDSTGSSVLYIDRSQYVHRSFSEPLKSGSRIGSTEWYSPEFTGDYWSSQSLQNPRRAPLPRNKNATRPHRAPKLGRRLNPLLQLERHRHWQTHYYYV